MKLGIFAVILTILLVLFLCGYFWMIMPRRNSRNRTEVFGKWLYAHRGLYNNEKAIPENSLKAFQKAVDRGFGIELDVHLSKDGVPVVFHDHGLKRMCNEERFVKDCTRKELDEFSLLGTAEKIPNLSEVLALVGGKVPLLVELKMDRSDFLLCKKVDELLSKYKGLYFIESFNPLAVWWYRKNRKEIVRGQLSDAFLKCEEYRNFFGFILQNLLLNFLGKPDFVAYNHKYSRMLSRKLCRKVYGNTAAAWTIKNQSELEAAKKEFDLFIFDSFVPQKV